MPRFHRRAGRIRRTLAGTAFALVAPLLLTGCEWPGHLFGPSDDGVVNLGDYIDEAQVGDNLYELTVRRGAPLGRTDSAMLHAAVMTQSRGCNYFSFVHGELGARIVPVREPQSQTTGPRMPDPGRVAGVFNPHPLSGRDGVYTIGCFHEKPNDLVHEAAWVATNIRDRYGLP